MPRVSSLVRKVIMRPLFVFLMTSLDGRTADANGDVSWHNVDDEFNEFCHRQLQEADTLLLGRKTFQLMESFWPTAEAHHASPNVAADMNSKRKVVVSSTLRETTWTNVEFINSDVVNQIVALKSESSKAIALLGSSQLAAHLLAAGLIDQLRIMVNPLVLGTGPVLLHDLGNSTQLTHPTVRTFSSGNVLLTYERK